MTNDNGLTPTLVTLQLRLAALESCLNALEAKQEQMRRRQQQIFRTRLISALSSVKVRLVIGRHVGLIGRGDEAMLNAWIRGLGDAVGSIQSMVEKVEMEGQLRCRRKR